MDSHHLSLVVKRPLRQIPRELAKVKQGTARPVEVYLRGVAQRMRIQREAKARMGLRK